jgi:hypothetical protein
MLLKKRRVFIKVTKVKIPTLLQMRTPYTTPFFPRARYKTQIPFQRRFPANELIGIELLIASFLVRDESHTTTWAK